jgi:hypothetical protein
MKYITALLVLAAILLAGDPGIYKPYELPTMPPPLTASPPICDKDVEIYRPTVQDRPRPGDLYDYRVKSYDIYKYNIPRNR